MISVLFVTSDSVYKAMGLDCWDIDRNALNWLGGNSIVAHPPCRAWSMMRAFAKPLPGERELALWAVKQVRQWGGVLEHPIGSSLFPTAGIRLDGEMDEFGGFVMSVDQSWWGHRARKRTLLYIVGLKSRRDVPPYSLNFQAVTHCLGGSNKNKKQISKKESQATPPAFAAWLVALAEKCEKKQGS